MRATIAYYDPPRRPAAQERPDFTALPLAGKPVTISSMRAAGCACEITMKSAAGDLLTWENITYYHNQAHRWWYCPDMTRDEAYVFRSFDSVQGEPVPHSAFVNESCPASAPPRASVEVRVFAFYAG
jgi:hypothetical protein